MTSSELFTSDGDRPESVEKPDESRAVRWWSDEEDRRVLRKLDMHIVPWLFLTYLLAFLDRSNIGNAKTAGMDASLQISDDEYQWLLTIFYISYIVFQFLLICYKFVRPSVFMGSCVFVWGVAAILQGAAFNWQGLMAARFFIGLSEAGYGTGVALYLSFFYPRHEIGTRFAWFVAGAAVASAIAGSVAYAIQGAEEHLSIQSWRVIFIVEASPTIIVGVLLFFLLPNSIGSARFLTEHERKVAEARLYRATIDQVPANGQRSSKWAIVQSQFDLRNGVDAIRDPVSYLNAALLFLVNVGFSAIPVYLPTILSQQGYTRLRAQAFTAPPYAVSFVLAIVLSYAADKTRTRGIYLTLTTVLGIVGYFMLATLQDNATRYGAVWLVVLGLFPSVPLLYSYLLANSNGESKRGVALVIFGTVGQCGPVLGTRLFPSNEQPFFRKGMYINAGLLIGALLIIWCSMAYFHLLNKRTQTRWSHEQSLTTEKRHPERPLQFVRKIDTKTLEGQHEQHLRRLDIAEHREKSLYFTYTL